MLPPVAEGAKGIAAQGQIYMDTLVVEIHLQLKIATPVKVPSPYAPPLAPTTSWAILSNVSRKGYFITHHLTDMTVHIIHTPVVGYWLEREIAQSVSLEELIQHPITVNALPWSYISISSHECM